MPFLQKVEVVNPGSIEFAGDSVRGLFFKNPPKNLKKLIGKELSVGLVSVKLGEEVIGVRGSNQSVQWAEDFDQKVK